MLSPMSADGAAIQHRSSEAGTSVRTPMPARLLPLPLHGHQLAATALNLIAVRPNVNAILRGKLMEHKGTTVRKSPNAGSPSAESLYAMRRGVRPRSPAMVVDVWRVAATTSTL